MTKKLKKYKLIHGDCIQKMRKLEDKSIDIIVTSPPYNLGIKYSGYKDNKPYDKYLSWLHDVFEEIKRVMKPNGSFFLNIGSTNKQPWIAFDVAQQARDIFSLQNHIIWVKSISIYDISHGHYKPINSERFLNHMFEHIYQFTKSNQVVIDRQSIGVPYMHKSNIKRWGKTTNGKDLRCRGNTWFIPYETIQSKKEKGNHPAIFPPKLAEMCIRLQGFNSNTVVLDPFAGMGSTLIAAEKLAVKSIGIDIDKDYLSIAKERLKNET